jgi:hypothetical protein
LLSIGWKNLYMHMCPIESLPCLAAGKKLNMCYSLFYGLVKIRHNPPTIHSTRIKLTQTIAITSDVHMAYRLYSVHAYAARNKQQEISTLTLLTHIYTFSVPCECREECKHSLTTCIQVCREARDRKCTLKISGITYWVFFKSLVSSIPYKTNGSSHLSFANKRYRYSCKRITARQSQSTYECLAETKDKKIELVAMEELLTVGSNH